MYLMSKSDIKNTVAWHLSPKQVAQSDLSQVESKALLNKRYRES